MNKTFTYILTLVLMLMGGAAMAQRTDTPSSVTVGGSVFGGGNEAMVGGNCTVIINQDNATISHDVYGGGALAKVNTTDGTTLTSGKSTSVTLMRGIVKRDLYGGGLGDNTSGSEVAADVLGPVTVTIEGGTVTGSVFGCNNLYGAPKNTVTVNVENDLSGVTMKLNNVYGGGNLAAYTNIGNYPVVNINKGTVDGNVFGGGLGGTAIVTGNPKVTVGDLEHADYKATVSGDVYGGGDAANVVGTTAVLVQKCNTVINGDVYGGGNAAHIVKNEGVGGTTSVTVTGGTITGIGHGMVFGGGHGNKDATPDPVTANVETSTSVTINGGEINKVFGGSNSAGTINGGNPGGISVLVNKSGTCTLHLNELYGGGNFAASQVGSIDIRCTGTGENDRIDYVYGGANQADITGNIVLNITQGHIGNVFGGNNTSGSISGTIQVNINKNNEATCPDDWYVGNVYGGGNHAAYGGSPDVNIINGTVSGNVYGGGNDITDGTQGILNSDVVMTGGAVLGGIYGGCKEKGSVTGYSEVTIHGGTIGSQSLLDAGTVAKVFGGGLGENTNVVGNVTVTISRASGDNPPAAPTIYGDVYGGSALGSVNSDAADKTTVNILNGTLVSNVVMEGGFPVYYGGNVFGGGLGVSGNTEKGKVNGKVVVNIGAGTPHPTTPFVELPTGLSGNAIIGGNVYGCNNSGGMPQDDVTVNIFQTNHTTGSSGNGYNGTGYAIANVFGGGNEADYTASGKTAYVNIYTCDNTIGRVFGGGNAAAAPHVETNIQGGRIGKVFGGGNGERGSSYGADISAGIDLTIHGGNVGEFYGGSNQHGTITGTIHTDVVSDSPCELVVDEFFCGGNFVDIDGDLVTTIACSDGHFTSLYGGCKQANITGDVILNLRGGTYTNVFGGSKGRAPGTDTPGDPGKAADIGGNVTLNLYGGTIENVFGGSNINGNIAGTITVNVLDEEGACPLYITNLYGGSNETDYTPTNAAVTSPIVNLVHAKYGISGNVYGGSKGVEGVIPPTTVTANPLVNIGYVSGMTGYVLPTGSLSYTVPDQPRAIVAGSVFGGGDAAQVSGSTVIFLRDRAKVFGNIYGGGNMGVVTGNTKVIVNGENQ